MTEFDQVYQKYFRDVYKYLLSSLPQPVGRGGDHSGDLFKVLEKLDQFDDRSSLYSWLCQIAKHTYFDHCRREKRKGREEDVDAAWPQDSLEERRWTRSPSRRSTRGSTPWRSPIRRFFSSAFFGSSPSHKSRALSQDGKLGPGDLLPGKRKNQGGIAMNVPCGLIQDLLPSTMTRCVARKAAP